jgi:hypothetical protein
MNKQETWDEKRQDTKWKGLTQGAKLCDSFFFFHIKKQETAPSYSVSSHLTVCLCSCAPQNESLYFSSRSCCSLAFYQLHQHIKFKNSKYTFYFTILYYYCEVTLFREIGASAYRINREWSLTAPYYFSHLDCKYDSLFFFYNKK